MQREGLFNEKNTINMLGGIEITDLNCNIYPIK